MAWALLEAMGIAAAGNIAFASLLVVILLLNTPAGLRSSAGYVAGYAGTYWLIGLTSLWAGRTLAQAAPAEGPPVAAGLYLILGVVMLGFAFHKWRRPKGQGGAPSWFLKHLDAMTPGRALALGVGVALINGKNLGIFLAAMAPLVAAPLSTTQSVVAVSLTTATFCLILTAPPLIHLAFPRQATAAVSRLRALVEGHSRRIILVVVPILGGLFLLKGLRGALG